MSDQPATPECDKIVEARPTLDILGEFYDWLQENHYRLCKNDEPERVIERLSPKHSPLRMREIEWFPVNEGPERIFAKYLKIDMDKAEEERRTLLEWIRSQNELFLPKQRI